MILYIERYGNLGGNCPIDTYSGHGETEAVTGTVSLADIGCGGFYSADAKLEIIAVSPLKAEIGIFRNRYEVFPDNPLVIERKSTEIGDGGRFTAFDEITVTYKGNNYAIQYSTTGKAESVI